MRIRTARDARRLRARSAPLGPSGLALAAVALLSSSAQALDEAAPKRFSVEIALPEGQESFHRGGTDPACPVQGLVVTVTLTNTFGDLPVSLPEPTLAPHGGVGLSRVKTVSEGGSSGLDFEICLLGAPTGVPKTEETPERTRVRRSPLAIPVSGLGPPPAVTLPPGESKSFQVNVGTWFGFQKAGRYEMSCAFENERSNTVEFEVLPLKVVDMRASTFLGRVEDFERDGADYPFMFYVLRGDGRFNEVAYLVRRGLGDDAHYEYHRLAETALGKVPQVVSSPEKPGLVGVLVPDKRDESLSRIFTLDFGRQPLRVSGREVGHEPGEPPRISIDDEGKVSAR